MKKAPEENKDFLVCLKCRCASVFGPVPNPIAN